jgi:hypothetical protein
LLHGTIELTNRLANTEFSGEPAALPSLVRCNSSFDGTLLSLLYQLRKLNAIPASFDRITPLSSEHKM